MKLRKVQTPDLAGLFHAWFHAHHRQKARNAMTLAAKMSRKQKLNKIFETAARAEQSQDHFMLFQTIRELAPKQSLKRIMLRSAQGDLLGPVESAEWINNGFRRFTLMIQVPLDLNLLFGHSHPQSSLKGCNHCQRTRPWHHPMHQHRFGSLELRQSRSI